MLDVETEQPSSDSFDRKALAGHLMEIARQLKPNVESPPHVPMSDKQLSELRSLLLGREINQLEKLSHEVENPEQFALAVGRVLHIAIAHATADARLGQVLVPALERAAENSVRNDPRTLIDVLYPVVLPAIRKAIAGSIDESYQSFNETLKQSFSLRGLRWRWESWRTGLPFAQIVLRQTLIYDVEHVFLIHRKTGLLIAHVAAENAGGQDPQLVSSMLSAIQDFVRDSFSDADQGLDTLRLGDLKLWSEAGPSATLVAVIRGNPPESLRAVIGSVLARIHTERPRALETFNGDSSGFQDVEATLTECLQRGQSQQRVGSRGMPLLLRLTLAAAIVMAAVWGGRWWLDGRAWDAYVARLRAQPGIVVTEAERRGNLFVLTGMRDPLAVDPQQLLEGAGVDPSRVVASWAPYEALQPEVVLKRLKVALEPPASVKLMLDHGQIAAQGQAPAAWLEKAHQTVRSLPAGAPQLNLSGVVDNDADEQQRWNRYVATLRTKPGIVVTEVGERDGKLIVSGLRDPLSADPSELLRLEGLDPTRVSSSWAPYQALYPEFVLKRLTTSLDPPEGVQLSIKDQRIVADGAASRRWIDRARFAARLLPAGAPELDLSGIEDLDAVAIAKLRDAISKVRETLESRTIHFDYRISLPASGQDDVLDAIAAELRDLAALSSAQVHAKVMLTGHSDSAGEGTFNLALSVARAEAVRALLKTRGVDPKLLAVRGAGPLEPVDTGTSKAALAANRRVSFSVGIEEQP